MFVCSEFRFKELIIYLVTGCICYFGFGRKWEVELDIN